MASLNLTSYGTSSVSGYISGLSNTWSSTYYQYAYLTCNGYTSAPSYPSGSGTSTGTMTVNGSFSEGSSYTVSAYAVAANGTAYSAGSSSFTVPYAPLSTPSYSSHSVTGSSITITFTSVSGATWYDFDCTNGSFISGNTSPTWTVTGLSPNTQYGIMCRARNSNTSSSYSAYKYITTLANTRPNNWTGFDWITSGGVMPKYNGTPYATTAAQWNQFTARINEFRAYKSLSNYSFTTATQGGTAYAWMYNQAITAINAMSPPTTTPSSLSSGSTVTAYFFNRIQSSLNSIS